MAPSHLRAGRIGTFLELQKSDKHIPTLQFPEVWMFKKTGSDLN